LESQFCDIVSEHYGSARARFGHLVNDPHLADDLTQQVFLVVCDRLDKGEKVANWRAFVCGVALNIFREHLRKKRRRKTVPVENVDDCVSMVPSPANRAERNETRQRLWRILNKLGAEDREIVTAIHAFGLSAREVGAQLGIPRRKVLHNLTRALDQMREMARLEGLALCGCHGSEPRTEADYGRLAVGVWHRGLEGRR
jgi:RNA polymerase sigma-70 factor (ECF subfamily)